MEENAGGMDEKLRRVEERNGLRNDGWRRNGGEGDMSPRFACSLNSHSSHCELSPVKNGGGKFYLCSLWASLSYAVLLLCCSCSRSRGVSAVVGPLSATVS